MTVHESVKTCFRKNATFSGRAQRSELLWFVLFVILTNFVLGIIENALFGNALNGQSKSILSALFLFAVFLHVQKGTEGPNRFGPDPLSSCCRRNRHADLSWSNSRHAQGTPVTSCRM